MDAVRKAPSIDAERSSGSPEGNIGPDTPTTSPSSKGSFLSPHLSLVANPIFSEEASEFLSNLGNYLPLGCLYFEDLAERHDHDLDSDRSWRDIKELPYLLCTDPDLSVNLARLLGSGWIRIQQQRSVCDQRYLICRIYVLPGDIGLRFIDRQSKRLNRALERLVGQVDINPVVWQGSYPSGDAQGFDPWATLDEGSLFFMFNQLPSPAPSPTEIDERYAREAMEDLLDPMSVLPGLKTVLYPYQRRSAGLMLQRESVSKLQLDPRLEPRTAPDGSTFYYGARDLLFLRQPRFYEACRGGILAETMGLGKTVILISLILATKHHAPRMPAPYTLPPTRPRVGSLVSMAVSTINRKSVPWKVEFERIRHATGDEMNNCVVRLEASPPSYEIPQEPARWQRNTIMPPPKKMIMASTTLIVVPRNLCKQWQSEIEKHTESGALSLLVMEDSKRALPPVSELRSYDIILFSRNRFELEIRDGSDEQGRRIAPNQLVCRCPYIGATRTRDCHCVRTDDLYDSPLKQVHFKRLVIDEGHFFSNSNSTAVTVVSKLITVDHRWVVSGTPAKDLLGVEVDLSSADNLSITPDTKEGRNAILDRRRSFSYKEDTAGAIKSLGSLASNFLNFRPWAALDSSERKTDWDEYIYRHEDLRRRTYSGFSSCLRRTLEAMVVKTQPEDVERDIELPPLSHEVVRLEPSFYDKLTANLFTLVLTANAITSERTDTDYLFHKNSQKARCQLISNLRQSAFFWTGFSEADVLASKDNSNGYLAKVNTKCTDEDRKVLSEMLACADTTLLSAGWKSLSRSHELGLFVDNWPMESAEHWAFDGSHIPLLTGVSQLLEAQRHVDKHADRENPGEGLAGVGVRALTSVRHGSNQEIKSEHQVTDKKPLLTKSGIPISSIDGEPALGRRGNLSKNGANASPRKQSRGPRAVQSSTRQMSVAPAPVNRNARPYSVSEATHENASTGRSTPSPRKRRRSETVISDLPDDSPYLQSRIVGTTSAKLSYLVSQILKYYQDEKILVFYDGDNVAYYIAQLLELFHIKHEIYAKSLAANLKSEYVVRFDQETQDRVLLMDVKQAAFGLNLSSASRIYFVNPVCRPNIEAQAIKRAHRIGQAHKVFVETLVLKGTIEERMLERSKRMTRSEHLHAKVLEDDGGITEIIQSARALLIHEHEKTGYGQMAALEQPQQLWGRSGWRDALGLDGIASGRRPSDKKRRTISAEDVAIGGINEPSVHDDDNTAVEHKREALAFVDCTDPTVEDRLVEEDSEDEPIFDHWRRKLPRTVSISRAHPWMMKGSRDQMLPSINMDDGLHSLRPSSIEPLGSHGYPCCSSTQPC